MLIPRSAVHGIIIPAIPEGLGATLLAILYQFEHSEWWSPGELRKYQCKQLSSVLNHAATTTPFYRERLQEAGVTLGVVMAHELGHLLLGSHNHSARGVMKPQWSRDDLMKAYFGGLGFNREQIKRIRSSVVAREQAERERTKERVSAEVR